MSLRGRRINTYVCKDDLDMLGVIYWHVSVISLPLGNLEFYTVNLPKLNLSNVVYKSSGLKLPEVSKLAEN